MAERLSLNELCLYNGPHYDETEEVIFNKYSEEGFTALCYSKMREREIWISVKKLEGTGQIEEVQKEIDEKPKRVAWTIGEDPPAHLIKQKKKRR